MPGLIQSNLTSDYWSDTACFIFETQAAKAGSATSSTGEIKAITSQHADTTKRYNACMILQANSITKFKVI